MFKETTFLCQQKLVEKGPMLEKIPSKICSLDAAFYNNNLDVDKSLRYRTCSFPNPQSLQEALSGTGLLLFSFCRRGGICGLYGSITDIEIIGNVR